jgi:UDP-N-acetylglucosamine 2-epimerase (non-hydrolysing)
MPSLDTQRETFIFIVGTRPEAIKLAPLILEVKSSGKHDALVVLTNQHPNMAREALESFAIKADYFLDSFRPNQTMPELSGRILSELTKIEGNFAKGIVVVQGDTVSAFIGALYAFYSKLRVVHIEAGLRTGNRLSPYPEEANRLMISRLADLHIAPTDSALKNLLKEGIPENMIFVSGNTCTDAVRIKGGARNQSSTFSHRTEVLVTLHRRENQTSGLIKKQTSALFEIFSEEFCDMKINVIQHPNPNSRSEFDNRFLRLKNVIIRDPLTYDAIIPLLNKTRLIITDSGGLQEEATYLGIPTLILRESTERKEALDSGVCSLVSDSETELKSRVKAELGNSNSGKLSKVGSDVFGDGYCSRRILDAMERFFIENKLETS